MERSPNVGQVINLFCMSAGAYRRKNENRRAGEASRRGHCGLESELLRFRTIAAVSPGACPEDRFSRVPRVINPRGEIMRPTTNGFLEGLCWRSRCSVPRLYPSFSAPASATVFALGAAGHPAAPPCEQASDAAATNRLRHSIPPQKSDAAPDDPETGYSVAICRRAALLGIGRCLSDSGSSCW